MIVVIAAQRVARELRSIASGVGSTRLWGCATGPQVYPQSNTDQQMSLRNR